LSAPENNPGSATGNGELVARYRENHASGEAYRELYERYAPATFGYFYRQLGDPDAAADLNQDLHLRLARSIRTYRGECSWKTWVFTLARKVLAQFRSERWSRFADSLVSLDETRLLEELPSDAATDLQADSNLLRARLMRCIRLLDDLSKVVILGHYFQGITLREMTERLGLNNPSGSRAVLIAAQRRLRRCLQEGVPAT
jgi:RNA polymerase sigma-70 factor (ECF subfamily)